MECPNCKAQNRDGVRYCSNCGKLLNGTTSAPLVPMPCSGRVQATPSCATLADEMLECATRVLYRSPFGEGHSLAKRVSSGGAPGGTEVAALGRGGAQLDTSKQAKNDKTATCTAGVMTKIDITIISL